MKKRILAMVLALVMVFSLVGCGTTSGSTGDSGAESGSIGKYTRAPAKKTMIELVAGGTSGSWYSIFAAISEIVNKETESNITLKVTPGGGIGNPATVGAGEAEMGLTYGSFALAATKGEEPYAANYDNLYALSGGFMSMYLEISALANSGVTDLKEAMTGSKPARILTGISSTSTGYYFARTMDYYGTSAGEIANKGGSVTQSEYGDWSQMASDGHVDLMFNHIGIPSSTLSEIVTSRECKLLNMPQDLIDYLVSKYAMVETVVPAGSYSWQTEDIHTVKSPTVIVVNGDVSDDAVYTLLEIIDEHQDDIRALHATLADFDLSTAWQSAGITLHPGAQAFFKDKGYM